jgi:Fic family protein
VGVMRYRGAPPEDCEYLLNRLAKWLDEIDSGAPTAMGLATAVLRAVLAHLYIAWIHPFGDGNGRTARLVEFAILSQAGVPTPAAHLMSNHYNQTRSEYYRQLAHASESGGDVMPFLGYAVQGFLDGLREQIEAIREQQLDVAWRNYVHELFKDHTLAKQRCRNLVLDLSRQDAPIPRRALTRITPRVAEEYAGKTQKTLSRDINTLRRMKLIVFEPGAGFRARTEIIKAFLPHREPPKASAAVE